MQPWANRSASLYLLGRGDSIFNFIVVTFEERVVFKQAIINLVSVLGIEPRTPPHAMHVKQMLSLFLLLGCISSLFFIFIMRQVLMNSPRLALNSPSQFCPVTGISNLQYYVQGKQNSLTQFLGSWKHLGTKLKEDFSKVLLVQKQNMFSALVNPLHWAAT